MIHTPQPLITSPTRRRFLQGTLRGMAGLAAWHQGWLRPRTAAAPTRDPSGQAWMYPSALERMRMSRHSVCRDIRPYPHPLAINVGSGSCLRVGDD